MRLIGITVNIIVLLIYLIANGILGDFIDYAIFGIGTFSNNLSYGQLLIDDNIIVRILAVIMPTLIFAMLIIYIVSAFNKKLEDKEWLKNLAILLVYTLATIAVIIPIADKGHFIIGMMCRNVSSYISFIYVNKRSDK